MIIVFSDLIIQSETWLALNGKLRSQISFTNMRSNYSNHTDDFVGVCLWVIDFIFSFQRNPEITHMLNNPELMRQVGPD